MSSTKIFGLVAGFIFVAVLVLGAAWKLGDHFQHAQDAASKARYSNCTQKGQEHVVIIKNEKASPQHTNGKQCDTLTITNEDGKGLLIAFGLHDHHQPYDGVTERELRNNQSLTVTMNETGTFDFHDHLSDIVQGSFTVKK